MRVIASIAFLIVVVASASVAQPGPTLFHRGPGGAPLQPNPDACWSEPPDLNGLIASSEQILAFGLETEIANDFVPTSGLITHVIFWGGAYDNNVPCQAGVPVSGLNLRFYEDAGCVPGTMIAELHLVPGQYAEESAGCQSGEYPLYKWGADVGVNVVPAARYWFSGQISDHAFPPQFGRLCAFTWTDCISMFKSAYFGYPDWTPCFDGVSGVWFEGSQEFECETTVPVKGSSWGRIKGLYR